MLFYIVLFVTDESCSKRTITSQTPLLVESVQSQSMSCKLLTHVFFLTKYSKTAKMSFQPTPRSSNLAMMTSRTNSSRRLSSNRDGKVLTPATESSEDSSKKPSTGSEKAKDHSKTYLWTQAEAIAFATKHTTEEAAKYYEGVEKQIMSRINESNTKKFRMYFWGTLFGLSVVVYAFGSEIKQFFFKTTAGIAAGTLENEKLKVQTQELATAVIQTVLNDQEVTSHAAKFLREAAGAQETQEALLRLTEHVLKHPDTIKEVVILVQQVVNVLHQDQVLLFMAMISPLYIDLIVLF